MTKMKMMWIDSRTKQWECCGLIWQLMMSPLYSRRDQWKPICPICGANGGREHESGYYQGSASGAGTKR